MAFWNISMMLLCEPQHEGYEFDAKYFISVMVHARGLITLILHTGHQGCVSEIQSGSTDAQMKDAKMERCA